MLYKRAGCLNVDFESSHLYLLADQGGNVVAIGYDVFSSYI